jgi:penicillin amidase
MKRIARWSFATVALLVVVLAIALWLALRASLPKIDGELQLAALERPATIERDRQGTPTIKAHSRSDLAFATGYVHAQDRFFQMDLLRRAAAGELAALLGPAMVDTDKRLRVHGFRNVARQVADAVADGNRAILAAYADGVNAGLATLGARPWEYLVLGVVPDEWRVEDCVLVAFSMYLSLNDSTGETELARGYLRDALPPEMYAFLHPFGTEWDAPIAGGVWRGPPIPNADVYDLRRLTMPAVEPELLSEPEPVVGSNSWAVAATHSGTGSALLANDMHLGLRLPNTWYRARLIVDVPGDEARDLVGVTLPGLPNLIAGSNGRVAWGYTNSYGDWTDLVIVELDPLDSSRYLVGDESQPIGVRREEIRVRGAPSEVVSVQTTQWGPIVGRDALDRPLALAWTAHRPAATNLRMLEFEGARNVQALLDAANAAGGPVQNTVAADTFGSIGWSLFGRVPVRANYDPSRPSSWRDPGTGWIGWREPREYPRIVDPPTGRLWTANTRTIGVQAWRDFLGDGGYDLGARAAQIRDGLFALNAPQARDMLQIQLDDRALFLVRWRDLLLELLASADSSERAPARELVEQWSGRAAIDDAGYRIVREFRLQVRKAVFESLIAPARTKHPQVRFEPTPQFEGPLWQLVTERPPHLLDPRFRTWEEALLASLDVALGEMRKDCNSLRECTWGRQNRLQMRHPLSSALPFASRWLDMPAVALPGDSAMPRVQGAQFGASQRIVVSPGREAEGLFHMPGGPVDHPLSPFYGAGHEAWARGEPQPLLPGEAAHRLQLRPLSP